MTKLKQELSKIFKLKKKDCRKNPSLTQVRKALEKLRNIHKNLRVIHIAGTNGKGSTAAMLEMILRKKGYKTGLFTSPHLVRYNERFQINRNEISDDELLRYIKKIHDLNVDLSFFEFTTVLAFLYFFEQKVDFAILETGMGGRFDATNVCESEIAIITDISLDHTHIIGDTIEKISEEKAGIIKENSKVIIGKDNTGLRWIEEKDNELFLVENYEGELSLRGEFQKRNAALAEKAAELLGVDEMIIKTALKEVEWQGRLEEIKAENYKILLDCAHNVQAITEITKYVKNAKYNQLIIIFGVLETKDFRTMIKKLAKPDFLILTKPDTEKALDPIKLAYDGKCAVIENIEEAIRYAKNISQTDDLILITGSCYLVGNVKKLFVNCINQKKFI